MQVSNKKKMITNILMDWYFIDCVLFGRNARNAIVKESEFKQYIALKGTMLSNLFEYWNHIGYVPSEKDPIRDIKTLKDQAIAYSRKAKAISASILNKESVKKRISKIVMNEAAKRGIEKSEDFSEKVIQEKFYQIALDNVLIGIPLLESSSVNKTDNFKGRVLEESHRATRNAIVRLALTCERKNETRKDNTIS